MRVVLALLCALLTLSVAAPALAAEPALSEELRRRRDAVESGQAALARRGDAVTADAAEGGDASAQSGPVASVSDGAWDDEVWDERGDIASAWADYRQGDVVRVGFRAHRHESPTAYNWAAGITVASWYLDTNGDAYEDYEVLAFTIDGRPTAAVLRSDDLEVVCEGSFTASSGGGYVVDLPASCVGDPGRVRFAMAFTYDVIPDDPEAPLSVDVAPNTAFWSPWATRGARPFRHAKPAARRGAAFYLRDDLGLGATDQRTAYGLPGDVPLLCDWDGNGTATLGVFRAGRWWVRNTNGVGASTSFSYGTAGDVPVCGDWDGDGRDTPGIYRGGRWYLRQWVTQGASYTATYGLPTDIPVVGDWDGDGRDTVAVVRGSRWYLRGTGGPTAHRFDYGYAWDTPVVGDWDGDGRDTPGIYRGGDWLVRNTLTSGPVSWAWTYGLPGDTPLVWR